MRSRNSVPETFYFRIFIKPCKVRHGNTERKDPEKGKSAKAMFHFLTDLEYWLGEWLLVACITFKL